MAGIGLTYFQQVEGVVIDLHSSLLQRMLDKEGMERAMEDNRSTIEALAGVGLGEYPGLVRLRQKLESNERAVKTYELAINIIAGAILQIAKQAIAICHGPKLQDCPVSGRAVAGSCVRDIVWLGRNQSMHFEETRLTGGKGVWKSSWVDLFQQLDQLNPGRFAMVEPFQSHAKAVMDLLGWTYSYSQFQEDMRELTKVV